MSGLLIHTFHFFYHVQPLAEIITRKKNGRLWPHTRIYQNKQSVPLLMTFEGHTNDELHQDPHHFIKHFVVHGNTMRVIRAMCPIFIEHIELCTWSQIRPKTDCANTHSNETKNAIQYAWDKKDQICLSRKHSDDPDHDWPYNKMHLENRRQAPSRFGIPLGDHWHVLRSALPYHPYDFATCPVSRALWYRYLSYRFFCRVPWCSMAALLAVCDESTQTGRYRSK